jgi:hydrophobic/amphiphilic exporter-1 (mainly G- bacteria), HAE1 family
MTSFAFILGCSLSGSLWARGLSPCRLFGTAVTGGMLVASFIAIFMVPVLFYLVERFSGKETPVARELGAQDEVSRKRAPA